MRRVAAVLLALVLAVSALAAGPPAMAHSHESGNHYLSETYGFRVNWDDRIWFVVQQDVHPGWDEIVLSDGISYVFFAGVSGYGGQVQPCLDDTVQSFQRSRGVANVAPLTGDDGQLVRGKTDDSAFAAYRYTYSYADGTTVDFVRYTECRTLVAGESVITIDTVSPAASYDDEVPVAHDLIAGLALPSPGEPGPVFVAGQWRLAVAGVARGGRLRVAGLAPKAGKDWLLAVVDAANWGAAAAELDVKDFGLGLNGGESTVRLAPSSTVSAARKLGTAPSSANKAVRIAAGQTRRFTIVFQIPHSAIGPSLDLAGSALPLGEALIPENRVTKLPATVGPPFLREARVASVFNDGLVRLDFLSDGAQTLMRLVGTDLPAEGDCYGRQARAELDRLVGQTVRVEREAGPLLRGYLWTETSDGTLSLVNQHLVVAGFATTPAGAPTDRFGAWLAEAEHEAQTARAGLWGDCVSTGAASPATPTAATPVAG